MTDQLRELHREHCPRGTACPHGQRAFACPMMVIADKSAAEIGKQSERGERR